MNVLWIALLALLVLLEKLTPWGRVGRAHRRRCLYRCGTLDGAPLKPNRYPMPARMLEYSSKHVHEVEPTVNLEEAWRMERNR